MTGMLRAGSWPQHSLSQGGTAEGTQLLLRPRAAVLWDGDLSCPPAREFLSAGHRGLSPPRRAPAWQPGCRAPSSPGTHGNTVPGERAGAGRRADFRPLPSAAPGPSPHPPCSPPSLDDSWLPVYAVEQATVDFIQAFASSPQQEERQKTKFLECICVLCRAAKQHDLCRGLDVFCHRYQLAEKIQALLEEEPRDQMRTAMRQKAMRAIAALSSAGILLEGKKTSLLQACFSSVFFLPPNNEIRGLGNYLYHETLIAMDEMLETLVLSTPACRVSEQLQSIFQVWPGHRAGLFLSLQGRDCPLLMDGPHLCSRAEEAATDCASPAEELGRAACAAAGVCCQGSPAASRTSPQMLLNFTDSERAEVRERAVGRISLLSCVLSRHSSLEGCDRRDREIHGPDGYRDIEIPVLGRLLGRLLLFRSSEDETKRPASEALCYLSRFLKSQEGRSRPKQKAQQLCWEHQTTSSQFLAPGRDTDFLIYLSLWERTVIVLVFIEAVRDHSIFDKEVAIKMLDEVMAAPDLWLTDAPAILSYIHKNLEDINTAPARQSVESLLLLMAIGYPREAVRTMLKIALPGDSTARAMWEVMFSIPQVLEEIFNKLLRLSRIASSRGLHSHRKPGACVHVPPTTSASCEMCPSWLVLFQYLEGLLTRLERADMARKMLAFLPHMMEVFHGGSTDIKRTVLLLCRKMLGRLKKEEASPVAVQLAAELLPLFDHECSRMREISISLFRELLGTVVGNDRRRMEKMVQRGLLPLFFRMHDEVNGVAKGCAQETPRCLSRGTSQHPKGGITPGTRAGGRQVSFPRPWCHLTGSAALQVSGEALLAAAELLKWKELRHLLQTQQTQRIGECLPGVRSLELDLDPCPQEQSPQGLFSTPRSPPCKMGDGGLSATGGCGRRHCSGQVGRRCDMPVPSCSLQLARDRSQAEAYCRQSLPYLQDVQAAMRETAVRFLGEPQPPGSLSWQPGPSPCCRTGSEEQPCAAGSTLGSGRADEALCLGLAARPLRDQSPEMVSEICSALQNLVKDREPSISSLAAQTLLILRSPQEKPRSGRTLRALCC
ncbi:uncharacterized protein VSU04_015822 [Chlamydotis macqueenii]